jgi:hypothetical protein
MQRGELQDACNEDRAPPLKASTNEQNPFLKTTTKQQNNNKNR